MHVRASLIAKWLTIGRTTAAEVESLDREVAATEKIVTSLLGKNVVPSFPFSILTIVQMLESNQAHSTVGTSFGHLYEALIKASLTFAGSTGAYGAEDQFTYVSLVAFRMFDRNVSLLTERELREIADEYGSIFQVTVDFQRMLSGLRRVKVLDEVDGNYFFRYKHFYFYFVAKYFDRAMRRRDQRSVELRAKLIYCADRLHNEELANVVLFYVHLSQDWELVLRPLDYVTKLMPGLLAGKLPLDGNPVAIHMTIPGPSLLAQASDVSDSTFP